MKKTTFLLLICLIVSGVSFAQSNYDVPDVSRLENSVPEIYFKSGKSKLTKQAKEKLDSFIIVLNQETKIRLRVYGWSEPKGSKEKNLKLSEKRVQVVMDYFMKKGIPRNRIVPKAMGEVSIGNEESLTEEDEKELFAHCNRVDFKLFMFMGF